jgi:hypothetical protein
VNGRPSLSDWAAGLALVAVVIEVWIVLWLW